MEVISHHSKSLKAAASLNHKKKKKLNVTQSRDTTSFKRPLSIGMEVFYRIMKPLMPPLYVAIMHKKEEVFFI